MAYSEIISDRNMKSLWCLLLLLVANVCSEEGREKITVFPKPISYEDGFIYGSVQALGLSQVEVPNNVGSFWSLNSQPFHVSIWPPKYCQTVFLCFVPNVDVKQTKERIIISSDTCSNGIKVYPFENKMVHFENGVVKDTYPFAYHILSFEVDRSGQKIMYKLDVYKQDLKGYHQFSESSTGKTGAMKIDAIILLTNSVQCRATIVTPGSSKHYYPLYDAFQMDLEKAKYAKSIAKSYYMDKKETMSIPAYKWGPGRSLDHLFHLKSLQSTPISEKRKECASFVEPNPNNVKNQESRLSNMVSTLRYGLTKFTGQTGDALPVTHFYVTVSKCHWLRVSFFQSSDEADYKKNPAKYSFDFFFDEGFFQTPDSDEAKPLAQKATAINTIEFSFAETSAGKVGEIFYGKTSEEEGFSYRESFSYQLFKNNEVTAVLTRAPLCDALHIPKAGNLQRGSKKLVNTVETNGCEYGLWKQA